MKLSNPYTTTYPSLSKFEAPFPSWLRHPFANVPSLAQFFDQTEVPTGLRLPTDVFEDADHYFVRLEVPGVKKEGLSIELKDRELTVTASSKVVGTDGEESYSATRSLSVPAGIAADQVTAKLENGILTLTLPKPAEQKPRAISIG
jgi:HSP20 family protein